MSFKGAQRAPHLRQRRRDARPRAGGRRRRHRARPHPAEKLGPLQTDRQRRGQNLRHRQRRGHRRQGQGELAGQSAARRSRRFRRLGHHRRQRDQRRPRRRRRRARVDHAPTNASRPRTPPAASTTRSNWKSKASAASGCTATTARNESPSMSRARRGKKRSRPAPSSPTKNRTGRWKSSRSTPT